MARDIKVDFVTMVWRKEFVCALPLSSPANGAFTVISNLLGVVLLNLVIQKIVLEMGMETIIVPAIDLLVKSAKWGHILMVTMETIRTLRLS